MTTAQIDHLRAIEAHLDRILAIAAKRTPGRWEHDGPSSIVGQNEAMSFSIVGDCGTCIAHVVFNESAGDSAAESKADAAFISACSNNAEAGWRSTKAAIADWLSLYNSTEGYADGAPDASAHDKLCNEVASICRINLRHILAEWPIETLKP